MTRIVTSTDRYNRPLRKPQTVEAPAVFTIDTKMRIARRGSRHRDD